MQDLRTHPKLLPCRRERCRSLLGVAPVRRGRPRTGTRRRVTVDRDVSPQTAGRRRPRRRIPNLRPASWSTSRQRLPGLRRPLRAAAFTTTARRHIVPLNGQTHSSAVLVRPAVERTTAAGLGILGPELQQYHFPTLRGVAFTGDFEGQVVRWGLSAAQAGRFPGHRGCIDRTHRHRPASLVPRCRARKARWAACLTRPG